MTKDKIKVVEKSVLVPFIMVYRGFTGKYLVEIKVYGDEIALGKAHIDSDLD